MPHHLHFSGISHTLLNDIEPLQLSKLIDPEVLHRATVVLLLPATGPTLAVVRPVAPSGLTLPAIQSGGVVHDSRHHGPFMQPLHTA